MAVLTGAGVRIVLVGTGQHVAGSELPELPAVSATVTDLARALVECCGAGPERVRTLLDPASPLEFGRELTTAAAKAEDVLLVCYVGHGLLDARGELYLATQATGHLRDGLGYTALPYVTVCEELARSRARSVVVLLDCCFSGRASGSPYPTDLDGLASTRFPGGYLLTSAAREEMALAPRGERYTAFTGELIRLLHDGDPAGPRELTLDYLYQCLDRALPEQGRPRPRRYAAGRIGELALAPNPAYQPPALPTPRPPPEGSDALCPYRGLASYDVADAQYFFGREALTEQLVARLAEQLSGAGMLMVVGPSGSGKSSLLRAGLIPALEEAGLPHLPGSRAWPRLVLTPGTHPITTLASRLGPLAEEAVSTLGTRLAADPTALSTVAQAVAARHARGEQATDQRCLILVIDQFEELFTLCEDTDERRAFLDAITSAAASTALVVLGLRADFYAQCATEPQLLEALERSQLIVTPMNSAELRAAIEGPAAHAGLTLEPGLVTQMLRDLRANEGEHTSGLPLLSHALLATWQQRENNQLTLAGYAATGGIWQAVTRTAEDRYAALTPTEQDTAQLVLLRMVHLGEGGTEDTRRRIRLTDLPHTEATAPVLRSFADARLITLGADTAEITHEALLRAWPRLAEWINADRTGLRTHQQLSEAAETWEDTDRDPAALYRGTRLALARTWATEPGHQEGLTTREREFLHASIEEQHREEQATRQRTRRLRQLVAALTVLLVFFIAASIFAATSKQTANYQRDLALSREVANEATKTGSSDVSLAMQLSLAAYRIAPTTEALSALLSAPTLHTATRELANTESVYAVAVSPDGRTLAVGSGDQAIRLYDITHPRAPTFLSILTNHIGTVLAVAFSPDGHTLASASSDRTVRLWNAGDPHHPTAAATLTGYNGDINAVAFSPDGHTLAAGGDSATTRLWDVSDLHHPTTAATLTGLSGTVLAVAFSPDGHTLATSDDSRTVRLWNVSDPHHPTTTATLTGYNGKVNAVAFSPDGHTLASGSNDKTVRLWDMTNPHHPTKAILSSHTGGVNTVTFSPDGHTLAVGGADGTVQLWDMTDLQHPSAILTGHTDAVDTVAFSPDGRTLVTTGYDARVLLWDTSPNQATKDICSLVHTPITPAQWHQYIPDLPYNPPCASAH